MVVITSTHVAWPSQLMKWACLKLPVVLRKPCKTPSNVRLLSVVRRSFQFTANPPTAWFSPQLVFSICCGQWQPWLTQAPLAGAGDWQALRQVATLGTTRELHPQKTKPSNLYSQQDSRGQCTYEKGEIWDQDRLVSDEKHEFLNLENHPGQYE